MKKTTLTLSLLLAAFPLAIFTAEIAEKDPFLAGLERAERVMHSTSLKPPTKQQLYAHRSDDTPDSRLAYINQENYPHLAHFFKAHPLPADIEQIAAAIRANPQVMAQLQKNYDQRYVRGVWHTQNGFCIKNGDIERQLWALRMQKCIKEKNLTKLAVAPVDVVCLSERLWVTVSPEIQRTNENKYPDSLPAEVTKESIALANAIGFVYWDTPPNKQQDEDQKNWLETDDGTYVCIDTGGESFCDNRPSCLRQLQEEWYLSPDSKNLIKNELLEGSSRTITPEDLAQHDDADTNFEAVIKEFKELTGKK